MSNMTEEDWKIWLAADDYKVEVKEQVLPKNTKNSKFKHYKYKKGHGTPKAQFYITEDGIAGTFGFWCPKSAIINDDGKGLLEIKNWCKIKEIEYI